MKVRIGKVNPKHAKVNIVTAVRKIKSERAIISSGGKTTIVVVEPSADVQANEIIVDKSTFEFLGEPDEIDVAPLPNIENANNVKIFIRGPAKLLESDLRIILDDLPFSKGETVTIGSYSFTIVDSDKQYFTVGEKTKIEMIFDESSSSTFIDLFPDIMDSLVRAVSTLSKLYPPRAILLYGPPESGIEIVVKQITSIFSNLKPRYVDTSTEKWSVKTIEKIFMENKLVILDNFTKDSVPKNIAIAISRVLMLPDSATTIIITNSQSDVWDEIRAKAIFEVSMRPLKQFEKEKILEKIDMSDEIKRELLLQTPGYYFIDFKRLMAAAMEMRDSIKPEDIKILKQKHPPSFARKFHIERATAPWEKVGGMENVKKELKRLIEIPLNHPDLAKKLKINPSIGIILYGPPGTGKTYIAKAIASKVNANFIYVNAPEVLNMWVGKSEETIREVFNIARQISPAIIFIDEIDTIAKARGEDPTSKHLDTIVNQLLVELDGASPNDGVFVIAATNRIDTIDPALLRPGRFGRKIYVGVPNMKERKEIAKIYMEGLEFEPNITPDFIASITDGLTPAHIRSIIEEASYIRLEKVVENNEPPRISYDDIKEAIKKVVGEKAVETEEITESNDSS